MIAIIAVASQPSSHAGSETVQSSTEALGTTEGKPITNGFVFIDGKYIAPPYLVTREGNGIYINGYLVEQPCPWPIPQKKKSEVPIKDPEMPQFISKNTSKYDKDLIEYLGKKKAYYLGKYGEKKTVKMMVKVYQDLPCVSNASLGLTEKYINVTWADGNKMRHRLIMPKRKTVKWTRKTILEWTERVRADYEYRLNKGDYYFLGSAHGRMTGTADGAQKLLGVLLPILETSKNARVVQQKLQQSGITFMDEKACEVFFSNRNDSPDLKKRIDTLARQEKLGQTTRSARMLP